MRWQRSAAARIPPSPKEKCVCSGKRGRQRGVAQVGGQRRGVDHHAGVEAPVGVEQRLDLAHRRVEVVAEHARVERAADAPVAVLGRVDAVELRHQRGDLVGDGGHRLDAAGIAEVDERADVQAADAAVAVEAGGQPVALEDRAERLDVVAEALGRDRGVLHERGGALGALAGGHQQPEAGLADLGQRVLLGGGLGAQEVVAVAVLAPGRSAARRAARRPRRACRRRTSRTAARPGRPRSCSPSARTRAWSATARGSSRRSSRSPPR